LGVYRLLIFNSYGSYLTKEFIKYCDNRKIILFTLLYISHLLQPLNIVIFQLYKHYYSKAIKQAIQIGSVTGCTNFNKVKFLYVIELICRQTFKLSIIKLAFR
ncbi:uncharacterized protein K441DRAFT_592805, partial [Cenococcum geophilum 1.58]